MKVLGNIVIIISLLLGVQGCATSQSDKASPSPAKPKSTPSMNTRLPGFQTSPYWNEQIKIYSFDTDIRIFVNAPAADKYTSSNPTELILYLLPNGNSIEQTIGKKLKEGDDWHFDIQHIGAQTRRLREVIPNKNIVIAYLEATPKNWPAYGGRHKNTPKIYQTMVQSVIQLLPKQPDEIVLSSHSGGGAFLFNFMNSYDHLPNWLNRMSFLDSVYNFSTASSYRHDAKFIEWLKASPNHILSLICYHDENITYNGKPVAGTISGKKTLEMVNCFQKQIPLSVTTTGDYVHWVGLNGRLDIILHSNPENKILHTVLVEKNGFMHAMTVGTPYQNKVGAFWGNRDYVQWIQSDTTGTP